MIGSLFSGIGGLELGLEWAGLGPTVWQVEKDDKCRAVLARHWPNAQRFDDVCTVGSATLAPVDLICGGFPCQDVSGAGKGAGLAGARSGLWYEYLRIASELTPQWIVVENVASGAREWLCPVRQGLQAIGYRTAAVSLSAFDVGAPHLRRRVFVVAHAHGKCVHEQPRRSTGQGRKDPLLATGDGEARSSANSDGVRKLQPSRSLAGEWRWSRNGDGWTAQPPVHGVAHGVPCGVDRNKQLGNAVVPQCAEVIGKMIRAVQDGEPWEAVFS